MKRIHQHPILPSRTDKPFSFRFDGIQVPGLPGETLSSALMAAGIRVFGRHPKDGSTQGIFCANGQCSQCLVVADGIPVKACMTIAQPGMSVQSMDGLPSLPDSADPLEIDPPDILDVPVLILGGGPAGLSAAIELASLGVKVLLVDDKDRLGGKLVLQTHRFFGSADAVFAGTRGIEIGARLARQVFQQPLVSVWLNATALAVFSDRVVGVLREHRYARIRPQVLLVATGARERSLVFPGNTLPGVYGAGAFQTLVNRDLVKASDRLFIVGGGNVGLIAGYHALQAGIDVIGLAEALPVCGGYKVHRDKLCRMGVPIYTSHTVLSAHGTGEVESVTIAQVDPSFRAVPGTEKRFACDTVLIAVGLDPVDEFTHSAQRAGLPVYAAGDAAEIAEASAAIFAGRIAGRQIALDLGMTTEPVPDAWQRTSDILKSRPGEILRRSPRLPGTPKKTGPLEETMKTVFPVFHCTQKIPCDPCASVCPQGLIHIDPLDIRELPQYRDSEKACIGCMKCVSVCPGLAISLVDTRTDPERPLVTVPLEFGTDRVRKGMQVLAMDAEGRAVGEFPVHRVLSDARSDGTALIQIWTSREAAEQVAGLRLQSPWASEPLPEEADSLCDTDIVCRCERVTAGEIRSLILAGHRDLNEIKTLSRAGMGACGGKTCQTLILRLFRECGVPSDEVIQGVPRPLFMEVPLGAFASSAPGGSSSSPHEGGGPK